jgi:uncharacterized protein (DUF2141 family)
MKILFFNILMSALTLVAIDAGELTVKISDIRSVGGYLLVGVFNTHESFELSKHQGGDTRAVDFKVLEINTRVTSTSVTFEDLPDGVYALGVIRDLNSNGKLDTKGPFHKPVEPFAMSGNPRPGIRFPKWEKVAFKVSGKTEILVQLKHL